MPLTPKIAGRRLSALVIGTALAVGAGFFCHDLNVTLPTRNFSYKLLHALAGEEKPPSEAAIVLLDDASYYKLKQPRNAPWDRDLHARLLDRLRTAHVRAVVFDIVFTEANSNNPAADERFAAAIK